MKLLRLSPFLFFAACGGPDSLELQSRALTTFGRVEPHHLPPSIRAEEAELGRLLFWDPILSGDRDVACASCHHPDAGYAERLDLSRGVGAVGLSEQRRGGMLVPRNAMSILNVALNGIAEPHDVYDPNAAPMFWDNRMQTLERQALRPTHVFEEMRGSAYDEERTVGILSVRLASIPEYVDLFERAFPGERIGEDTMSRAIAAFERTLLAVDAPFDRYMDGDITALNPEEEQGLEAFFEGDCHRCHSGPLFSDFRLHTNGVPDNERLTQSDAANGDFAFRTPTLRNVALHPPYMHGGVVETLEEVVDFYHEINERNGVPDSPVPREALDRGLRRISVPRSAAEPIAAFLRTLGDESFDRTIPARVPSGLPPGGNIDP